MKSRGPLIAGIASGLVLLLVIVFVVLPKRGEVKDAERDLEAAEAQELSLRTELARLQEARDEAPRVRKAIARFRRKVPPVADLPGMINLLQDAADISRVNFFSISPATPAASPTGEASEIPATVQVIGGFHQVREFLFHLETLQRQAKVVNISVDTREAEAESADGASTSNPDEAKIVPSDSLFLDVRMTVEFYTTDTTSGPGAPVDGG